MPKPKSQEKERKGKLSASSPSEVSQEEQDKAAAELARAAQEAPKPEVEAGAPEKEKKEKKRVGRPPGSKKKPQVPVEELISPDFLIMAHKGIFNFVAKRVGAYEWKPSTDQLETCSKGAMVILQKRLPDYLSKYSDECFYGGAVLLVVIDMMAQRKPTVKVTTSDRDRVEKDGTKTADDFGGMERVTE